MNQSRRIFMLQAIAASAVMTSAVVTSALMPQLAYAASMLSESDRDAQALGYRADSSRVDREKYPRFDASQRCNNCNWFQGRSGDANAACGLYSVDKHVAANGWCSGWMKKG